jgi:hypothetical protein
MNKQTIEKPMRKAIRKSPSKGLIESTKCCELKEIRLTLGKPKPAENMRIDASAIMTFLCSKIKKSYTLNNDLPDFVRKNDLLRVHKAVILNLSYRNTKIEILNGCEMM